MRLLELFRLRLNDESKAKAPILIAGLGRCGTTLVRDAILNNSSYVRAGKFIREIENTSFSKNTVYKTHCYPPKSLPENLKVVFLFGNPIDIVISTHYKINEWGRLHHQHLQSDAFIPNDTILNKDTLNLYHQFDQWYKHQPFTFISVKYENLYDQKTVKFLSDYLEIPFILPKFRQRQSYLKNLFLRDNVLACYGSLNDKIEKNTTPFKLWEKNNKLNF